VKTFYSILYAVICPETDEKIAVGLILSDGNNSLFDSSAYKLRAVRLLLRDDAVGFIRNYITAVKRTVKGSKKGSIQYEIFENIVTRNP
jgi:hypothetical protein